MDRFQIRDLYGNPYIYDTTTYRAFSETHDNLDELVELINRLVADLQSVITDLQHANNSYYERIDNLEDEITDLRNALHRLHEAA